MAPEPRTAPAGEQYVAITLSASDWRSILNVLSAAKKNCDEDNPDVAEHINGLGAKIKQQL